MVGVGQCEKGGRLLRHYTSHHSGSQREEARADYPFTNRNRHMCTFETQYMWNSDVIGLHYEGATTSLLGDGHRELSHARRDYVPRANLGAQMDARGVEREPAVRLVGVPLPGAGVSRFITAALRVLH